MRFIHAADIHLDSPLRGLTRYEGAPVDELRGATRRALQNLIDLAVEEEVDFVLIAGDVYDGDWKDHNTGLFFVSCMARLRDAGIPVFLISGNHDAANRMTRSLRLPDNVTRFSHRKPETHRLEDAGAAIHGRSFAQSAEYDNLANEYPAKVPGLFNIGLLHTSLTGADGHEPYAPCALDDLRRRGYDYWALGHVHTRDVKCEDPLVVFPGNIQGRHIREPGAKGCCLVTVDASGRCDLEFRELDVLRWATLSVDVNDVHSGDEILDRCNDALAGLAGRNRGMPLAVRLTLNGRTAVHQQLVARQEHWVNQIRSVAMSACSGQAWIEKVRLATSLLRPAHEAVDAEGPLAALVQYIEELRRSPAGLANLSDELADLKKKLPDSVLLGPEGLRLDDADYLSAVMSDVESLLVQRLNEGAAE